MAVIDDQQSPARRGNALGDVADRNELAAFQEGAVGGATKARRQRSVEARDRRGVEAEGKLAADDTHALLMPAVGRLDEAIDRERVNEFVSDREQWSVRKVGRALMP